MTRRDDPRAVRLGRARPGGRDWVAVTVWAAVITAAVAWGRWLGAAKVLVDWPPLHALWEPALGAGLLAPAAVAVAVVLTRRWQDRVRWPWLLVLAVIAAFAWMLAANMWRGGGLGRLAAPLGSPQDYQGDVAAFAGPLDTLAHYTERLPTLGTHNRGHPPGPLIVFEVLRGLGIVDLRVVALLVCAAGASAVVPVAAVLRRLAGEDRARQVLPVLVLAPYVLWLGVSFDAVFCAAAAWTAYLWSRVGRSRGLQVASGACFGGMLMLSYGLAPFALVLLALRRGRTALLWAAGGVAAVLGAAWAAGFMWFAGLAATNVEYQATYHLQGGRPGWYWWLGDLGALAIAAGPAAALSARHAVAWLRSRDRGAGAPETLTLAALAAVVFMVVSGVTKAEVERIWLPYMPWLLVAVPAGRARALAAAQGAWTLAVSALVLPWW